MILYRYINRQLFATTVVVAFVLTMVLVSGRFIKYMAEAAAGKIAADALFAIMLFRLPEFLQMILPLSLYIAVLLVFGRLHVDNEMVVMKAGGVGPARMLRGLLTPVLVMMGVIAGFSLYATPYGDAEVARIFEAQKERSVLELLSPGRFHAKSAGDGQRATYAESLDRERGELGNVFIADTRQFSGDGGMRMLTVRARTGSIVERDNVSYLQLRNGRQYLGQPGGDSYRVASFERSLVRLTDDSGSPAPPEVRGRPTMELLEQSDRQARAELQWRWSLVLLVPVMISLALPLSRVSPRQGPFMRLIPALLLYMLYLGLLVVLRSRMADLTGPQPWFYNMAWVHVLAISGVVLVYAWPRLTGRRAG